MNHTFYTLRLAEVRRETSDAVTLIFEPHPAFKQYLAGQFLTIRSIISGHECRRAYSLCSSPALNEPPAITIKRVEGGLMSTWACTELRAGMELEIMPAIGNFVYQPHSSAKRWFMLFAAGSGITPVFSILKTILAAEPQSFVSLLYGSRRRTDIIYQSELDELRNRFPSRFKLVHTLSDPDPDWYGETGRISGDKIMHLVEDLKPVTPFSETQVFMCGPAEMMDAISPVILSQGVRSDCLHREQFFRKVEDLLAENEQDASGQNSIVRIRLDGKWHQFETTRNASILDAALDFGLDMPYSCQSGLCTACRGKCIKGKVRMDETEGLSDQELQEGFVLTCVGHASSAEVEIEMG
jgi:ring-1,2-phenylacetyl-CoA epoxidase subunit PaaE